MALLSSLSQACRSVADFVSTEIAASNPDTVQVLIGNPADSVTTASTMTHKLNLFFFRFEPSGFQSGVMPDEPWHLRMHCLFTAFAGEVINQSVGENELRVLGEVMRIFHETPVLEPIEIDGEKVHLQAIFEPLTLDDLNHVWSTQGDTTFRPSIAYEIALAPVIPSAQPIGTPLVSELGIEAMPSEVASTSFRGIFSGPEIGTVNVDTSRAEWSPRVILVHENLCAYSLRFEVGDPNLVGYTPQVWVAGEPGAEVAFHWDVWDSVDGWRSGPDGPTAVIQTATIEPELASTATTIAVPLPFDDRSGQAVLYATRELERSDGTTIELRSNVLVVSLYEDTP